MHLYLSHTWVTLSLSYQLWREMGYWRTVDTHSSHSYLDEFTQLFTTGITFNWTCLLVIFFQDHRWPPWPLFFFLLSRKIPPYIWWVFWEGASHCIEGYFFFSFLFLQYMGPLYLVKWIMWHQIISVLQTLHVKVDLMNVFISQASVSIEIVLPSPRFLPSLCSWHHTLLYQILIGIIKVFLLLSVLGVFESV